MLNKNEKLALTARSTAPLVDHRFRLEDPRVLYAAAAGTYLLAVPAAFGWSTVALAACVAITRRVGFIDG